MIRHSDRHSDRPAHRFARCSHSNKQRYRNRHDAQLILVTIKHRIAKAKHYDWPTRRNEQRAYKCPHCFGWHLTSSALRE